MRLVADTKASRAEGCATAEEDFTIKMAGTTKDSGRTIRWMAMVSFTMKVASLLMKGNGLKINSTASVRFTMTILWGSPAASTTRISITLKIIGNTTKEC